MTNNDVKIWWFELGIGTKFVTKKNKVKIK